jgi:hypothetical protein
VQQLGSWDTSQTAAAHGLHVGHCAGPTVHGSWQVAHGGSVVVVVLVVVVVVVVVGQTISQTSSASETQRPFHVSVQQLGS